jgi:hypothetical protein
MLRVIQNIKCQDVFFLEKLSVLSAPAYRQAGLWQEVVFKTAACL